MRIQAVTAAAIVALAVAGCSSGAKTPAATATPTSAAPAATSSSGPAATSAGTTSSTGAATTTADAPGTAFTAYGVHTAWRAVVDKGVLKTEGTAVGERTVKVSRSAFAKGVDFTGTQGGTTIALTVRSGACVDASGQDTGMTAVLRVGAKEYRGCSVEGAIAHADT